MFIIVFGGYVYYRSTVFRFTSSTPCTLQKGIEAQLWWKDQTLDVVVVRKVDLATCHTWNHGVMAVASDSFTAWRASSCFVPWVRVYLPWDRLQHVYTSNRLHRVACTAPYWGSSRLYSLRPSGRKLVLWPFSWHVLTWEPLWTYIPRYWIPSVLIGFIIKPANKNRHTEYIFPPTIKIWQRKTERYRSRKYRFWEPDKVGRIVLIYTTFGNNFSFEKCNAV